MAEVCAFHRAGIKRVALLPFVTKHLDLVQTGIANVDIAPAVRSQSGMSVRIGQVQGAKEMSAGIENLNALVAGIENEDFITSNGDDGGETELSGTGTAAPAA